MSRNSASCILCGVPIAPGEAAWLNEFRAVYTEDNDWTNPKLSGVGVRAPLSDIAPRDPTSRYSDHDPGLVVDIFFFQTTSNNPTLAVPPMTQTQAWGFPCHDACWTLLKELRYPDEIDIKGLSSLCRSLPVQNGLLNWGHDYGGLVQHKNKDRLLPGDKCTLWCFNHADDTLYASNPLDIPNLALSVQKSTHDTAKHGHKHRGGTEVAVAPQDPFLSLSVEILQHILLYLPSKDILNLKLSSTIFAVMPLPEPFWASRFQRNFEFHCAFECRRGGLSSKRCWETLYFQIKQLESTPAFWNRLRIWDLLLALEQLMFSSLSGLKGCLAIPSVGSRAPNEDPVCMVASGQLKQPDHYFGEGCRVLWMRYLNLPCDIANIYISFVGFYQNQYISGIRFRSYNRGDMHIGYIHPGSELEIDFCSLFCGKNRLSGFYLAIDPRGLRAISPIIAADDGRINGPWVGDPCGIPRKRILIPHCSDSSVLKAGFDGLKMVSFAVWSGSPATTDNGAAKATSSDLRDISQWFPDVPDSSLCLNELSFKRSPHHPFKYRPLSVLLFGGRKGVHLKNLIGISVWIVDFERIFGIDFRYNAFIDSQKTHTLGCSGPFQDAEPSAIQRIDFYIDGPGGEVIEGIDTQSTEWWKLDGFQVHTNRGRSALFPPNLTDEKSTGLLPVKLAESTTITGLYSNLRASTVLYNLGLISERL